MAEPDSAANQDEEGQGVASGAPLVCPARLDIPAAVDLRSELVARLAARRGIALDVGALAYVDTAGIQLLCAVALAARRQGGALTWVGDSPALAASARQLGLSEILGLPGDNPST
jgi:anti-anti-sigma regulatory factor